MQILKRSIGIALLGWLLAASIMPSAQAGLELDENKIKAGLLYNFIKYTEWPASASLSGRQEMTICLYGGDPFAGALAPLSGRTAQQLRIGILRVSDPGQLAACNAVVIHGSSSGAVEAVTAFARKNNILTFSDIRGFARYGGMVEFSLKNERVQVLVNRAEAKAAQLDISPRLLKVATVVGAQ